MKSLGNHVNECACCTSRDTALAPCSLSLARHVTQLAPCSLSLARQVTDITRTLNELRALTSDVPQVGPRAACCTRRLHTPSPTAPLLSSPVKQTLSHVRRHRCNSTPSLPQHAPPSSQSAPSSAAAAAGQRKAAGAGVGQMAAAGKAAGAGAGQMAAAAGPRVKDDKARQPQ